MPPNFQTDISIPSRVINAVLSVTFFCDTFLEKTIILGSAPRKSKIENLRIYRSRQIGRMVKIQSVLY